MPKIFGMADFVASPPAAAAPPVRDAAHELQQALALANRAAEAEENNTLVEAHRMYLEATQCMRRIVQEHHFEEAAAADINLIADAYWKKSVDASLRVKREQPDADLAALFGPADGDATVAAPATSAAPAVPNTAPAPTPAFGGEGHRLVSDGPAAEVAPQDVRAARLAALERRQQASAGATTRRAATAAASDTAPAPAAAPWAADLLPQAKRSACQNHWGKGRAGHAEFYGGDQVLVHEANAKQEASRAENAAFCGEGHRLAGRPPEGQVAGKVEAGTAAQADAAAEAAPAIHPLAAKALAAAAPAEPPKPLPKLKPPRSLASRAAPGAPAVFNPFGGGYVAPPPAPSRFRAGARVEANMGLLQDGTYLWAAGVVEAVDVWEPTHMKQFKYRVRRDDGQVPTFPPPSRRLLPPPAAFPPPSRRLASIAFRCVSSPSAAFLPPSAAFCR